MQLHRSRYPVHHLDQPQGSAHLHHLTGRADPRQTKLLQAPSYEPVPKGRHTSQTGHRHAPQIQVQPDQGPTAKLLRVFQSLSCPHIY